MLHSLLIECRLRLLCAGGVYNIRCRRRLRAAKPRMASGAAASHVQGAPAEQRDVHQIVHHYGDSYVLLRLSLLPPVVRERDPMLTQKPVIGMGRHGVVLMPFWTADAFL